MNSATGQQAGARAPAVPGAAPAPNATVLVVTVHGVRIGGGRVLCAMYTDAKAFAARSPMAAAETLDATASTLRFELPAAPGQCAVLVFQDADGDGDLTRGAFGIPSEPWNCSGRPSRLGPPTWATTAIPVVVGANAVELQLR